ncbi:hypothetical protein Droror1_Dr00016360 [Drosera rotundifolia]
MNEGIRRRAVGSGGGNERQTKEASWWLARFVSSLPGAEGALVRARACLAVVFALRVEDGVLVKENPVEIELEDDLKGDIGEAKISEGVDSKIDRGENGLRDQVDRENGCNEDVDAGESEMKNVLVREEKMVREFGELRPNQGAGEQGDEAKATKFEAKGEDHEDVMMEEESGVK